MPGTPIPAGRLRPGLGSAGAWLFRAVLHRHHHGGRPALGPAAPARTILLRHATSAASSAASASSTSTTEAPSQPPRPNTLAKPTRFRPPSHPPRLPQAPPRSYPGPPSSAAPKRKRYPGLFPEGGSFLHWFLTSRGLHMCISIGVLLAFYLTISIRTFYKNTPSRALLPSWRDWARHPFRSGQQYMEIAIADALANSADAHGQRERKLEDVQKRKKYRKAHDIPDTTGIIKWLGFRLETDEETREREAREHDDALEDQRRREAKVQAREAKTREKAELKAQREEKKRERERMRERERQARAEEVDVVVAAARRGPRAVAEAALAAPDKDGDVEPVAVAAAVAAAPMPGTEPAGDDESHDEKTEHDDDDGKPKTVRRRRGPPVKRWFGIWE
ncbi:MAG: hypothetical protein M1826_002035 [Phylliscum demangeonii]|nr:MAG: hypothetical protein M1826_002035 [Phylliscum demangeonii]